MKGARALLVDCWCMECKVTPCGLELVLVIMEMSRGGPSISPSSNSGNWHINENWCKLTASVFWSFSAPEVFLARPKSVCVAHSAL